MDERIPGDVRKALTPGREDRPSQVWLAAVISVFALAAGLVALFFLDPRQGRGRRAQTVDRLAGSVHRLARRTRQSGRWIASEAYGAQQKVRHIGAESHAPENDATLAHKVESELFRDSEVPKGHININAEEGVVVLRGTANTPEQIDDIERRVRSIGGVVDVRNLLHLPNTPSPEWSESTARERTPVAT
jgi:hypothetical protein